MADYKKIDDFSEASAFEDTDKLLVSKAKVTYTILGSKIKAFCQAAISTLVAQVNSDATAAANAKTAAQTAQTNAETANTNAQDAKTAALSAKTDAQTAASTATAAAAAMQECAAYSSTKAYAVGNMATYNGSTYRCTTACTGVVPTNTSNWLLIAAKGTDGQGAGDMLASVYDASNKQAQIATESELTTHTGNANIHVTADQKTAWNGKQAALTFDATPTSGSTNPVTSNGIYAALAAVGGLFVATYGTTTSAQIEAAYQAGKIVCIIQNSCIYTLTYRSGAGFHSFTHFDEHTTMNEYSTLSWIHVSDDAWSSGNVYLANNTILNRSTPVNVADTNYTTLMARGIGLVSADTTPTVNGAINFTYG